MTNARATSRSNAGPNFKARIADPLLGEFFARRGQLSDDPWDDLTEHKIEPVFETWQALPEEKQFEIQITLLDINELADHRGLAVLAEELLWRCSDRAEEFKAQPSRRERPRLMQVCGRRPTMSRSSGPARKCWPVRTRRPRSRSAKAKSQGPGNQNIITGGLGGATVINPNRPDHDKKDD